jgi:HEAT repeat protein
MNYRSIIITTIVVVFCCPLAKAALPTPKNIENMIERTQKGLLNKQELSTLRQQSDAKVVESLSQYLLNDKRDSDKRWFAAILMGRLGGAEALDHLIVGLGHEEFFVRLAAIKGLELMKNPVSINALHRRLFDSAMVVRAAAADAVGRFSDRQSLEHLERGLFHKDNYIKGRSLWARKNFVYAIGSIGGQKSLPALLRCLNDKDKSIQKAALNSLNPALEQNRAVADSDVHALSESWRNWWKKIQIAKSE